MPIALTTAYNPGDADSGGSYTHVDVTRVLYDLDGKCVDMTVWLGTYTGTPFVFTKKQQPLDVNMHPKGYGAANRPGATPPGVDFDDFEALLTNGGEKILNALQRTALQWLLDKAHFVGTIV